MRVDASGGLGDNCEKQSALGDEQYPYITSILLILACICRQANFSFTRARTMGILTKLLRRLFQRVSPSCMWYFHRSTSDSILFKLSVRAICPSLPVIGRGSSEPRTNGLLPIGGVKNSMIMTKGRCFSHSAFSLSPFSLEVDFTKIQLTDVPVTHIAKQDTYGFAESARAPLLH
ncbi:hypothetical protein VTK56DRAFT_261 [Thermocarpiscus australiensis]